MEKAELLPAFLWICPGCGCDNFERTIVAELSKEELAELRNEHGVEVWGQGEFLTSPTRVTCSHCKESFDSEEYGINNDSSDEELPRLGEAYPIDEFETDSEDQPDQPND